MKSSVSVVIPAYNAEDTLREAVESALAQTAPPAQIIVVDDLSKDGTAALTRRLADEYGIEYLLLEENRGGGFARNAGADRCTGEFIAFLDADDIWSKDKLERQLSLLQQHVDCYCFSAVEQQLPDGRSAILPKFWPTSGKALADFLLRKGGIAQTSTIIVRNEHFQAVRFDDDLRRFQDVDLVLRLERAGFGAVWDDKPTTTWRAAGGKSRVTGSMRPHYLSDFLERHDANLTELQRAGFLARNPAVHSARDFFPWLRLVFRSLLARDLKPRSAVGLLLRVLR